MYLLVVYGTVLSAFSRHFAYQTLNRKSFTLQHLSKALPPTLIQPNQDSRWYCQQYLFLPYHNPLNLSWILLPEQSFTFPRYFSLLSVQFAHLISIAHFCTTANTLWTNEVERNSLMSILWHKDNGPAFFALALQLIERGTRDSSCTELFWAHLCEGFPSSPEPWDRVA